MKTAVTYYRMSTKKQDKSIGEQRAECERYAKQNGYKITREYIDEGISGDKTEKRLAFLEMIANVGESRYILCWNQDRFGRFDSLEAGYYIKPIRDAGVKLTTCDKGVIDWNSFTGRVMNAIEQEGKHTYLTDLSRNVSRGMGSQADKGRWVFGAPPFGYRTDENKRLVVVPEQARIVRRIFQRYLAGDTLRMIASELNQDGIPSPRPERGDGMWKYSVVRKVLKNEIHTGVFVYGRQAVGKYYRPTPEGPQEATGQTEGGFKIPDNHEAIVSQADYQRVLERFGNNKTRSTPHTGEKSPFVLTGLLFCSHCGKVMYGEADCGRKPRYTCGGYKSGGKAACDCNRVLQASMVDLIVGHVERWADRNAPKLADKIRKRAEELKRPSRVKKLQAKLQKIEAELRDAEKRLLKVDDDMIPIVSAHIRELKGEQQEASGSLRVAEMATETADLQADEVVARALEVAGRLSQATTAANPREVRTVMQSAIARADLTFHERKLTGGDLHLKFSPIEDDNLCPTLYH